MVAGSGGHAYTVTVTNAGPSDADAVAPWRLSRPPSAGLLTADLGGDCSARAATLHQLHVAGQPARRGTWTVTIPYMCRPRPRRPAWIVNVAIPPGATSSAGVDAADSTDIVGQADLRLTKGDGVASWRPATGSPTRTS